MTSDDIEFKICKLNPDFFGIQTGMPNQCLCAFIEIADVTLFNGLNLMLTHAKEFAHHFK